MYICKNKSYIAEDIFNGRDSDWFANMQKNGNDEVYDFLPLGYGISDQAPQSFSDNYKNKTGYYGFHYINVKEFKNWFEKKRPDIDAGWVTRYEAWAYEKKGIKPVYLQKELHHDDVIEDKEFIEVINDYDCSVWLYNYLINHIIPDDAIIQYVFDR